MSYIKKRAMECEIYTCGGLGPTKRRRDESENVCELLPGTKRFRHEGTGTMEPPNRGAFPHTIASGDNSRNVCQAVTSGQNFSTVAEIAAVGGDGRTVRASSASWLTCAK
jgi:hypothetical protein